MLLAHRRVFQALALGAALFAFVSCGRRLPVGVNEPGSAVEAGTLIPDSTDGNLPPEVQITVPRASALLVQLLKPGQTIRWEGVDPDGHRNQMPVAYKFKFFFESDSEIPLNEILSHPNVLRAYEPDYQGWETVGANVTSVVVPDGPLESGVLAVVAVDQQGATTATFTLFTNVLRFRRVDPDAPLGPRLTVFNAAFNITTVTAVPPAMPPAFEHTVPVPAGSPVTLNWFGTPPAGLEIDAYRWGLDLDNVLDEPPGHWSQWDPEVTSATVGPFRGDAALQDHLVYIEARDGVGNITLVAIRLHPVPAPPQNRRLLIVDDTRLRPDRVTSGVLAPPLGPWPTAAELDTFLFARGGYPWQGYPAGTTSSPGLFAAYDFDTLGTRTLRDDLTVPLETLLQYENVIWITDPMGATFTRPGTDFTQPQTALRYMTAPGRLNTLAQFASLGGRVWVLGAGAGYASTIGWNRVQNDMPTTRFSALLDELAPARFMWDITHWRSEFRTASGPMTSIARAAVVPVEFARIPAAFALKTPATDPLPPLRASPGDFYRTVAPFEFLTQPNAILENGRNPHASHSMLDTLYRLTSAGVLGSDPSPAPIVTYYRGGENGAALFSGIDLWTYQRAQCQQMVDAVLQDVWHLAPSGVTEPMRRSRPTARVVPAATRANGAATTTPTDRVRMTARQRVNR